MQQTVVLGQTILGLATRMCGCRLESGRVRAEGHWFPIVIPACRSHGFKYSLAMCRYLGGECHVGCHSSSDFRRDDVSKVSSSPRNALHFGPPLKRYRSTNMPRPEIGEQNE